MQSREFVALVGERWAAGSFVSVGLDVQVDRIPAAILARHTSVHDAMFEFNRQIIDATADVVCAYKPNSAFYEAEGVQGVAALVDTIAYVRSVAPGVPVILDAKRADIGNTNEAYARFVFDVCGADALTVHPYLGAEGLRPFLDRPDWGVIVLCRTSNPGAGEFQDSTDGAGRPLFEQVAHNVAQSWNRNGNCGLVVGATYPEELRRVRHIAGDLPILIPGVGAQGGDLTAAVMAGRDSRGGGMIVNAARTIIYASSGDTFAADARTEVERMNAVISVARQQPVRS